MFEVKLTIAAEPQFLEALQAFAAAFTGKTEAPAKQTVIRKPAAKTEEPKQEEPAAAASQPEEAGKTYTIEEVRAEAGAKASAGLREEVKALLTKCGATSVSTLDEAKYSEFMAELVTLKKENK